MISRVELISMAPHKQGLYDILNMLKGRDRATFLGDLLLLQSKEIQR